MDGQQLMKTEEINSNRYFIHLHSTQVIKKCFREKFLASSHKNKGRDLMHISIRIHWLQVIPELKVPQ